MLPIPEIHTLLGRVRRRQMLVDLARRGYAGFLILAAVYGAALLTSRLTGLLPDGFGPASLLVPPGLALGFALVFTRPPGVLQAARRVDRTQATSDLFLTAAMADRAAGAFRPLVVARATAAARSIRPDAVVPFHGQRPSVRIGLILLALAAGVLFLPPLDLLGQGDEPNVNRLRQDRLADMTKATQLRVEQLKAKRDDQTPEVKRAVQEVKKTLRSLKPGQIKQNGKRLTAIQRRITDMWKKTREEQVNRLDLRSQSQRFGGAGAARAAAWRKGLEQGKSGELRKETAELKALARRLSHTKDPAERERIRGELEQRLQGLKNFATNELGSPALRAALDRAIEQLQLADLSEFRQDALKALGESLDLTDQELESLCREFRNLKALENALEVLQLGKACNRSNCLNGKGGQGSGTQGMPGSEDALADYESFLRSRMNGSGSGGGQGSGMRGAGTGTGNKAPEDESGKTDFQSEKARSALQAGRLLLKWRTREEAPPGQAEKHYQKALREVKQGMSEAVLRERIPAGYQDAIRKYFDSIGK